MSILSSSSLELSNIFKQLKKLIANILIFITIFFMSFYIPFIITVYSPTWYAFNFRHQPVTTTTSFPTVQHATNNLIDFFYHQEQLNSQWQTHEKSHMADVRIIYDSLAGLAILSVFVMLILVRPRNNILPYITALNMLIYLIALVLIIPSFEQFWGNVFHNYAFSNTDWKYYKGEISFYLFPLQFFKYSILFIGLFAISLNFILFCLIRLNKSSNSLKK